MATVHAVACEGLKARAVSALLKGVPQPAVEASLAAVLKQFGGGAQSCDVGSRGGGQGSQRRPTATSAAEATANEAAGATSLRRGQAKALALSAHDAVGAANLLCASPNAVRLALPHQKLLQERRKGVLPASFVLDALTLLRVCGVVAIQGLFEVGFVAELEAAHTEVCEGTS